MQVPAKVLRPNGATGDDSILAHGHGHVDVQLGLARIGPHGKHNWHQIPSAQSATRSAGMSARTFGTKHVSLPLLVNFPMITSLPLSMGSTTNGI